MYALYDNVSVHLAHTFLQNKKPNTTNVPIVKSVFYLNDAHLKNSEWRTFSGDLNVHLLYSDPTEATKSPP